MSRRKTMSRPFTRADTSIRAVSRTRSPAPRPCAANVASVSPRCGGRVLELVWGSHRAVKAYDLLAALGDGEGAAKPPTVYRALEFLMAQGLVHRIDSLNAFVGCPQPGRSHNAQFLICGDCGDVSELSAASIDRAVADQAAGSGFALSRKIIELHGKCPRCTTLPQTP